MKLFPDRWALYLGGGIFLAGFLNAGVGFVALKRLEKKAGAPIRGRFLPHLYEPAFTLKNPNLEWRGRFQVSSGTLRVHYDPLFLLPGRKFRARIEGQNLRGRLFGALAESQGVSEVTVHHVEVDFAFSKSKTPEIFSFHIQSPELQFQLIQKETEN